MRLLILFISFLISQVADSQIINASSPYRVRASGCSYLLDQYSGAAAAFSFRLLDCQYAGSCIRVRESGGNTESDIGFVGGYLDTATLKTFVGANDGFIVTWYDQLDTYDASQATSGSQPQIVSSGVIVRNDLGFVASHGTSSGTDQYLQLSPWYASTDAHVWAFSVYSQNGAGSYPYLIGSDPSDWGFISYHQSTSRWLYTLTNRNGVLTIAPSTTAYTDDVSLLRSDYANRTGNVGIYKNGSSIGSVADENVDFRMPTYVRIGGANAGVSYDFKICEMIFYNSDQSGNRAAIETAINSYYSIY